MGDAQEGRRLDPAVLEQIMKEVGLKPASLARRLCWVEYRRGLPAPGESWEQYYGRRRDSARQIVTRKSRVGPISSTKPATADNLAYALAADMSVPLGETDWKEAERRAQDYLGRMLTPADCVVLPNPDPPNPVPPNPDPPDPAADLLRSMVKEARAIADRVREYVDSDGARLNELLRAGTPPIANNPPSLSRLWEVLKHSEVGRTDVKEIDDAARAARKELDDVMAARERYGAERHASASLCATQGFTADTMQQYAADCRIDAEYAEALGRSEEAARVRDFAKRYEAYGRLLGAMEPLKETIASGQYPERVIPERIVESLVDASINRDVRYTDALHNRLEAAFMALKGKTRLALKQADRVRQKPKADRDEGTKSDD